MGQQAGRLAGRVGAMDGGFCENYNTAIGCPFVCSPCSEPFSMLSQEFPSLPRHAHMSEQPTPQAASAQSCLGTSRLYYGCSTMEL